MSDSTLKSNGQNPQKPRVVIVGGGFGGLAAAKALGKAPVEVILIDRTNHHVFQPLLYQVATSVLAPSQMSSPIREVLRRHKNTTVVMGEVTGVDKAQRCALSTPVTSPMTTVVFLCLRNTSRMGELICDGARTEVAT